MNVMATPVPNKMKRPGMLDNWSGKEKLGLANAVSKHGDQNWLSVSRAVRAFGEPHRPADWFNPRNCAMQYSHLLERVETPKRKRSERGAVETPIKQIMQFMSVERLEELKKETLEFQRLYKKLKSEVEMIESGQWDDQIKEKLEEALAAQEKEEEAKKDEEKKLKEMYAARAAALNQAKGARRPSASSQSNVSEADENTQDSIVDDVDVSMADEDSTNSPLPSSTSQPAVSTPSSSTPVAGVLLSHLLKSCHKSSHNLQRIKQEKEQVMKQEQQQLESTGSVTGGTEQTGDAPSNEITPASVASEQSNCSSGTVPPVVKKESEIDVQETITVREREQSTEATSIKQEVKEGASSQESVTSSENSSDQKLPAEEVDIKTEDPTVETADQKAEPVTDVEVESQDEDKSDVEGTSAYVSVDEISIKEEPASPASSVLSNISDSRTSRRSRGRGARGRPGNRLTRQSVAEKDDASSKHSEAEFTDDDMAREPDDVLSQLPAQPNSAAGISAFTESVPNSPASVGISDTEDEKAHKAWKRSIMLVWRAAANHKDANVFLHPVTNDIAPGYHNVVHRPMDMQTIKKNIESGIIRTTGEFQRDMMLMFTNAIMYNSSNHKVYEMAKKMYDDVMEQIEQYVSTQMMVQTSDTKVLRPSRRAETSDKEEDPKKRRSSVEISTEGGKAKKRKVRGDE